MVFPEAQLLRPIYLYTKHPQNPQMNFSFEFLSDKGYFVLSLSLHSLLPCLKLAAPNLLWTEWTIDKLISWKSRSWGKENAQWEVHELYYLLHGLCNFSWLLGGLLLLASFLYSRLLRLFSDWKTGWWDVIALDLLLKQLR